MKKTPEEIDKMFSEIVVALRAGDQDVYMWLHGQLLGCNSDDAACLAMGVISRLMPEFDHGPLN
jgi:hypothetical protein